MKKLLLMMLAVMMILSSMCTAALAEDEIKVIINGTPLTMDQAPVIVNSRTLVPMRAIFEGLGAQVSWDDEAKCATGIKDGKEIKITIDSATAYVDGKSVALDVPAQIVNSRTLVPVRFISESLGEKVDWDDSTKTVIITSNTNVKQWIFDDIESFVLDTDYIVGGSYNASGVSLSNEADHTTGNGKALKLSGRTKNDDRLKIKDVFTPEMIEKKYTVSAWVYSPNVEGTVNIGCYGDVGTTYAYKPIESKSVDVPKGEWTLISFTYEHKDEIVTQLGIEQRSATSALIETMYIDDITISEYQEASAEKAVVVTDGHRPVPTNFETGKAYEDLIYFSTEGVPNDVLIAALPEGEKVVDETALLNAAEKLTGKEKYGTAQIIDVEGMPFTKAVRADVHTVPEKAYHFQLDLGNPLEGKAEKGDVLLLKVYMRTEKGGEADTYNGQIQMIVEQSGAPNTKTVVDDVKNGGDWKEFYFPFTYNENNCDHSTVRLGYFVQTVDIGGYEVINYGNNVDISNLPTNKGIDPSLTKDAAWRKDAWDRIEKIRKGDIKVIVKDANGNLVENAKVDVNMYEHEFQFGSAIHDYAVTNEKYRQVVQTNFNSAVLENETKWVTYEENPEKTKKILEEAKKLGLKHFRGHPLVWDRDVLDENGNWKENTSVPKRLVDAYGDKDAAQAIIKQHIDEITADLKPYFTEWDVLNEAYYRKVLQEKYGRELINEWYDMARSALGEDAQLYYNDGVVDDELYEVLDILKANNVDYDGIGLQSHYATVTPIEKILEFYDELYTKYGKRLKITEYDFTTSDFELQGDFTRDILIASFSHEAVDGFIMWGFKGGTGDRYVLYDANYNPKPGLTAWQDLIYNKWWTAESGTTNANGEFATRGYFGDYDITVTVNGVTKTVSVPCYKGNDNTIVVTLD